MAQPQGGKLPFNSPYALHQLEAARAYQDALAQVNQQRNQYLNTEGYTMGAGGGLSVDGSNPYSAYHGMQAGIGQDTDRFNLGFHQGWGDLAAANEDSGIGGQQHAQFQQREGGIRNQFGQALLANLAHFTQAQQLARQAYNQSNLSNRNGLIDYLTSHQKFSKAQAVK